MRQAHRQRALQQRTAPVRSGPSRSKTTVRSSTKFAELHDYYTERKSFAEEECEEEEGGKEGGWEAGGKAGRRGKQTRKTKQGHVRLDTEPEVDPWAAWETNAPPMAEGGEEDDEGQHGMLQGMQHGFVEKVASELD